MTEEDLLCAAGGKWRLLLMNPNSVGGRGFNRLLTNCIWTRFKGFYALISCGHVITMRVWRTHFRNLTAGKVLSFSSEEHCPFPMTSSWRLRTASRRNEISRRTEVKIVKCRKRTLAVWHFWTSSYHKGKRLRCYGTRLNCWLSQGKKLQLSEYQFTSMS